MAFFKTRQMSVVKQDKPVFYFLISCLGLLLFSTIFLVIILGRLPATVPIFFSRMWGEPRLAPKNFLWILPLSQLFLGIFNFGFSFRFLDEEIFLSRVLAGISLVLSVLLTLSLINISLLML